MKIPTSLSFVLAVAVSLLSCSKESAPEATQSLQESFQAATPEIQTVIESVNTNLRQGNYSEATRTLAPVIQRPLTDAQKQAVGVTLQYINQEIAKNPSLDTKEMYELRAKMFQAVHRGPRF